MTILVLKLDKVISLIDLTERNCFSQTICEITKETSKLSRFKTEHCYRRENLLSLCSNLVTHENLIESFLMFKEPISL